MKTRFVMLLCALALAPAANSADAGDNDPAVAQVQTLSNALLKSMRAGSSTSMMERYRKLQPAIEQVFALPFMTQLSVGQAWSGFPPQQQKALVLAFSRYTIANYAHNFDNYSGQIFVVNPDVITRGEDKVVQTSLTSPGATPTNLLYRMRAVDGTWKVVDVYYNGVSQLALHRVQFASALGSGGAPALVAYLNKTSDGLTK